MPDSLGKQAYDLRRESDGGLTWRLIADRLGIRVHHHYTRNASHVLNLARSHAITHDLPWPPEPGNMTAETGE